MLLLVSVRAARLTLWMAGVAFALFLGQIASAQAQDATAPPPPRKLRVSDTAQPAPTASKVPNFAQSSTADGIPAAIPSDDASSIDKDDDDLDPQRDPAKPRGDQRAVLKDGDLADPDVPALRDGVIDMREPEGPVDGVDPTLVDTRATEEADLFRNPPSPPDPLLFQIEDTEPILDRRPLRLFRFEPYDPVGIKTGGFIFFPELEVAGNALSNVFYSPTPRSDVSFDVRPSARFISNWTRNALEFRASGLASFYNEFTTENDKAYTLEARGRLDITSRANLQIIASHDFGQESRSVPNARDVGTRPNLTVDKQALSLNQRFNRLTLQLRGSVTEYAYGSSTSDNVVTSNTYLDYTQYEQAARATWEFKPLLSIFTDVAVNERVYRQADPTGLDHSSSGERYRLGLAFGTTGEYLRGEVSTGYGDQHPDSSTLAASSGFLFDSNLTWRPSALTALQLNAKSDFLEATTFGAGSAKFQNIGLDVRQSFTRYLIGTAGIAFTNTDYVGSVINEQDLRETLLLEYYLSREAILFGRYTHVNFASNSPGASYESDSLRIGMRIRQ